MEETQTTIGIDLGGTNVRIGKITADGTILEFVKSRVPKTREELLDLIHEAVQGMLDPDVLGIGFGFPGRVDHETGLVLSAGFLDFANVNLVDVFASWTDLPFFLGTDPNMALFAEIQIGAAKSHQEIALLTIGTGIGGAIASDGELFYGNGCSAQLGHITVKMNGDLCNCGRRGCVETTSSGTALHKIILNSSFTKDIKVQTLAKMAGQGHLEAKELLLKWVSPLRRAMDSICATLGSDLILIGGGLGEAACQLVKELTTAESEWFVYDVKHCQLGDDAGVIGAGLYARHKVSQLRN
ncbi:ROK family protein [Chloroflexota bacterium]|nr:ROK family protein [Chloroflexota bacterium]